jgi:hypothetical protein
VTRTVPAAAASLLPLPPQAVSPSESAAATAAYFTIERRFITTPYVFKADETVQPPANASLHLL